MKSLLPTSAIKRPLLLLALAAGFTLAASCAPVYAGFCVDNDGANLGCGARLNITPAGNITKAGIEYTLDVSGAGVVIGGANTNVQFNEAGAFGGDPGFTWDTATQILSVGEGGASNNFNAVRIARNGGATINTTILRLIRDGTNLTTGGMTIMYSGRIAGSETDLARITMTVVDAAEPEAELEILTRNSGGFTTREFVIEPQGNLYLHSAGTPASVANTPLTIGADITRNHIGFSTSTGTGIMDSPIGGLTTSPTWILPDAGGTFTLNGSSVTDLEGTGLLVTAGVLDVVTTEIAATTWGSGAGFAFTFDAGATDPVLTFGSDLFTFTTGNIAIPNTLTATGDVDLTSADMLGGSPMRFEGTTADDVFTTLAITDPTVARQITVPDASTVLPVAQTCGAGSNFSALNSTTGVFTCTAGGVGDVEAVGDCGGPNCFVSGGAASTTLLSTSGTLIVGGVDGVNNEHLTIDGETTANEIIFDTDTAAVRLRISNLITHIGSGGTETDMDGNGDLYVQDEFEVDGNARIGDTGTDTLNIRSLVIFDNDSNFNDGDHLGFGSTVLGDARIVWSDEGNHKLVISTPVGTATESGNILVTETTDDEFDFGHAVVSNPHWIVHSSDELAPLDFISLFHDQTNPNIELGNGTLQITGGAVSMLTASTIGNLTLGDGSIIDSSGAISFGDENLVTTGTLGAGVATLATASTIGNLTLGDGSIVDSSGAISFGDENLTTTGTLGAGVATLATASTIGNLTLGDGSIVDSSGAISFGNENLTTTGTLTAGSFTVTANGIQFTPPTAQTIAAGNTVAADACGSLKLITAAGAVTTSTVDTFSDPTAANDGCVLHVCNTGAFDITLDNNAKFVSAGAADVVVTPNDCLTVVSADADGLWYQVSALLAN